MTGIVVLGVALVVSAVLGVIYQRRNGRFRPTASASGDPAAEQIERPDVPRGGVQRLGPQQIGVELGEQATLVQFSSAFCSPCRATRALLADVAGRTPGIVHVEIDAESHLELVRELDIMRTPTVLILDAHGVVVRRASGLPRRDQVMQALQFVAS